MQTDVDIGKTGDGDQPDIVWGAAAIGDVIGATARQTFTLIYNKAIPVKRIGGRYAASRRELLDFFRKGLVNEAEG